MVAVASVTKGMATAEMMAGFSLHTIAAATVATNRTYRPARANHRGDRAAQELVYVLGEDTRDSPVHERA
jgi:hypothetical protein